MIMVALAAPMPTVAPAAAIYGEASDTDVRSDGNVLASGSNSLLPGGSGSPALDRSSIFGFQLPDLGAVAAPFTTATFRFNLTGIISAPPNVDLYGLARRATSTVQTGDYYGETTALDPGDATFLQNNILTTGSPTGTISTNSAGSSALSNYLRAKYAGGAGVGQYVFLRLSTDAPPGGVKRYALTSADSATAGPPDTRPQIRYNVPVDWTLATAILKSIPAYTESPVRYPAEAKFNDALDCTILYYLTGDATCARCAADILHHAVVTLLPMATSTSVGNGGWIFQDDFLNEARVTETQLPIICILLYSHLQANKVYDVRIAGMVDFNFTTAQGLFRKFYQLARDHGSKDSSWSALMATTMLNNLLALDDATVRRTALQVYLTTGSSRQASLSCDYQNYTQTGGIWSESLQYAGSAGPVRNSHKVLLERHDPSLNLFDTYTNLSLSLPRISYLRYPNAGQVSFVDGHRAVSDGPFSDYELVYQHALARGRTDLTSFFSSLINGGVAAEQYNRSNPIAYSGLGNHDEPLQLLWQAPVVAEPAVTPELPGTDTVDKLFIGTSQKPPGQYGHSSTGATNRAEYVLGGQITTNDLGKLPAVSTGGENLIFTFRRDQASIDGSTVVEVHVGTTLASWPVSYPVPDDASANNPGFTVSKDTPSGFDTMTLTIPQAPEARKFACIAVNLP